MRGRSWTDRGDNQCMRYNSLVWWLTQGGYGTEWLVLFLAITALLWNIYETFSVKWIIGYSWLSSCGCMENGDVDGGSAWRSSHKGDFRAVDNGREITSRIQGGEGAQTLPTKFMWDHKCCLYNTWNCITLIKTHYNYMSLIDCWLNLHCDGQVTWP